MSKIRSSAFSLDSRRSGPKLEMAMSSWLETLIEAYRAQEHLSWLQHGHKRSKPTFYDVTKGYKFEELGKEVEGEFATILQPWKIERGPTTQHGPYSTCSNPFWVYNVSVRT